MEGMSNWVVPTQCFYGGKDEHDEFAKDIAA
jgi:hypothetical protein